jgi:hypothetical protein
VTTIVGHFSTEWLVLSNRYSPARSNWFGSQRFLDEFPYLILDGDALEHATALERRVQLDSAGMAHAAGKYIFLSLLPTCACSIAGN